MSRILCWIGLHSTVYTVHESHWEGCCHVCGKRRQGEIK